MKELYFAFNGIMKDPLLPRVSSKGFEPIRNILAGEDGQLKIWSRNGMLRSGLVQSGMDRDSFES